SGWQIALDGSAGALYISVVCAIASPSRATLFPYTTLFRSAWLSCSKLWVRACTARSSWRCDARRCCAVCEWLLASVTRRLTRVRSEEHTSELQSRFDLVCRRLLEKKQTTFNLDWRMCTRSR